MNNADYNTLAQTVLLFWDTKENYVKEITQQKLIPQVYKEVYLIDSLERMREVMNQEFSPDQKFLFLLHLDHSKDNRGLDTFRASRIKAEYPGLAYYCVSSTSRSTIYEGEKNNQIDVFSYDTLHTNIEERFVLKTKAEILGQTIKAEVVTKGEIKDSIPQFDYAILTALYDDEFEEIKQIFNFPTDETIAIKTKVFHVGYLRDDSNIKVIAGFLNETGPVESAIISTLMLENFKPKYLLMSGVCGGDESLSFGDIVVAKKVFAFQKGKLSDHPALFDLLNDNDSSQTLFDVDNRPIDIDHIYDTNRNQVAITVERFDIEQDAMINLPSQVEDRILNRKSEINDEINKQIKEQFRFMPNIPTVGIKIGPMASGTMVINKKNYFKNVIRSVDRKAIAVEMESYGLARACQFGNNGETIPIIFKSVMDYTSKKEDSINGTNIKKFAAFTSALFLKYMFKYKII